MDRKLFATITPVGYDPITEHLLDEAKDSIQAIIKRTVRVTDDMITDVIMWIVADGGLTDEIVVSKPAVLEAVQKSIGRRPNGDAAMPNCPHCGCALPFPGSREYTFCQRCGQRINWGE